MADTKSPEMRAFCNEFARAALGWDSNPAHCRTCNGTVGPFRDSLSRREYDISGMCQKCQDEIFTPQDGEDL